MSKLPSNLTEMLEQANAKPCIAGEAGSAARVLPTRPWKWKRQPMVPLSKRQIWMSRGEALAACFTKEKAMLTVTGTAQFMTDEKTQKQTLAMSMQVQPHFPIEHDMLERIAKNPDNRFELVQGQLVLKVEVDVPAAPVVEAPVQETVVSSASEGEAAQPAGEQTGGPVPAEQLQPLFCGESVQWVSQGVGQFAEPKQIMKFSDDGKFAFFEGSNTGIPVDELFREQTTERATQHAHEVSDDGKKCKHCGLSWKKVLKALKSAGGAVAEVAANVTVGQELPQ